VTNHAPFEGGLSLDG